MDNEPYAPHPAPPAPARRFAPPAPLTLTANVTAADYADAADDRLAFWARQAGRLHWDRRWHEVLRWDPPHARWFLGGALNAAVNCVDRHVLAGHGDRVALHWLGVPGDSRTITYAELRTEVCRAANALTRLGVRSGDRVALYLPRIPEALVAMLACARIGAPHTVIGVDLPAGQLAARLADCAARVVVTADGRYAGGAPVALKPAVDAAAADCPDLETVLVVRRTGQEVDWTSGRDLWWPEAVDAERDEHVPEAFDAEHPLFILHTARPGPQPAGARGILHTTGGYLTQVAYSHWGVFDLKADADVYWCTGDLGRISGHSYLVYGPLANGATQVMYEGAVADRWGDIVERYGVTILYTTAAAIGEFRRQGVPAGSDLSSLRLLGSTGAPIDPDAWLWYREQVGGGRCPVVDTWGQTETGAVMLGPLPGVSTTKPGAVGPSLPGVAADVCDPDGAPVRRGVRGRLTLTAPWPAMLRGVWGDATRFKRDYWSADRPGVFLPGDRAARDADGDFWVLGRPTGTVLSTQVDAPVPRPDDAAVTIPDGDAPYRGTTS